MPTFQVFVIGAAVFILDRMTKGAAEAHLASEGSLPVVPNIFHLTLVHNTGAAFGFLKGGTIILAAVTVLCIVSILVLLNNEKLFRKFFYSAPDAWLRLAFGLIIAGALGNLVDRVCYSYVIDFLDFRVWPVFNVADSSITIGGVILFFKIFFSDRKDHT